MKLGDIITDSIAYPIRNIKALLLYFALAIIIGIVAVLTGLGGFATGSINFGAGVFVGIIGIIVIICLLLLMLGFSLDIIKFGIDKKDDSPDIDFARQISHGLKYLVIGIVYLIIPFLIIIALSLIFNQLITAILGIIIALVFTFILAMAECRLAKTNNLTYALNIKGAFDDLVEIGVGKVVITIITTLVVGFLITFIVLFILGLIFGLDSTGVGGAIVTIISTIVDSWYLFYQNRAIGLLYSEI